MEPETGYMHFDACQEHYKQMTKSSLESVVSQMWQTILHHYFGPRLPYMVGTEVHPANKGPRTKADLLIRTKRNGQWRCAILVENKRAQYEAQSHEWKSAVIQLTGYMNSAPDDEKLEREEQIPMFGIVTIGRYSRFYILPRGKRQLSDYGPQNGECLEFKKNEEEIDALLVDIRNHTSY